MIIYPKAKINLGLRVIEKRDDGFHNLESLFVSVPNTTDILEIVESDKLSFSLYGASLDCEPGMNICEKAFKLLAQDFDIPGADIHLYKNIPSGAGLGGGSSDGACTLILINKLYELGLDTATLQKYASILGSDCPYFILAHADLGNTRENLGNSHKDLGSVPKNLTNEYSPILVTGKGDILERFSLDILTNFEIKIISPGIFISTAEAFSGIISQKSQSQQSASSVQQLTPSAQQLTPSAQATNTLSKHTESSASLKEISSASLKEILQMPPQKWRNLLINDFEEPIFKKYPQLAQQKELLYQQGAIYASMTGSGSSLFGLFAK